MTLDKKWILLPVEVHNREFLSRLLLACCAAEQGNSVIIGKKNAMIRSYAFLPKGMILDKAISGFRYKQLLRLRQIGYKISASDEESLGIYREPEIFLKQRLDENTLSLSDCFFAWGEEQANIIRRRYPEQSDKIITTGSHRLDLTRPEFHSLYKKEVDELRQKYGQYILFPSNFSEILNANGGRDYQLWQREKQGALDTEENRIFYNGFLDHLEKSLAVYKEIIPLIKNAFPDHKLVIRPHPGEDFSFWKEETKKNPGIEVIHEGNIVPWLLAADVMFHHSCSTGLEAYLLGTPGIAFHPFYNPEFDSHLSTRVGPIVEDKDKLLEYLEIAISKNDLPRDNTQWLYNYLKIDKEQLASDKIVNHLNSIDWPKQPLFTIKNTIIHQFYKARRYLFLKSRLTKRKLDKTPVQSPVGSRKWNNMEAEDVSNEIRKLGVACNRFENLHVEKLTGQIFSITSGI